MVDYQMIGTAGITGGARQRTIVATHPAPVGTYLVYAHHDAPPSRVPVVLWAVMPDGSPEPITMSGVWDGVENANSFVLHPDGSCSSYERVWDNLEEAVEEMKAFDRDFAKRS